MSRIPKFGIKGLTGFRPCDYVFGGHWNQLDGGISAASIGLPVVTQNTKIEVTVGSLIQDSSPWYCISGMLHVCGGRWWRTRILNSDRNLLQVKSKYHSAFTMCVLTD